MLVTPKNGTACLMLTLVTVATVIIHLTNNSLIVAMEANLKVSDRSPTLSHLQSC